MTEHQSHNFLANDVERSRFEWIKALGDARFKELVEIGALMEISDPDEFEGLFEFEGSIGEYRLARHKDSYIAVSSESERCIPVQPRELVYQANQTNFFSKIADANGFELVAAEVGQDLGIRLAIREVESQTFALLMVLAESWLELPASQRFILDATRTAKAIIVLTPTKGSLKPVTIADNVFLRRDVFPSAKQEYRIERSHYVHRCYGHSYETIAAHYPETKIILDTIEKRVFLLNKELIVAKEARSFSFLKGLCLMRDGSPMADEIFAKNYLDYVGSSPEDTVKTTKHQVREAIRKAFKGDDRCDQALQLCVPTGKPARHVKRNFSQNEVYLVAEAP